MAFLTMSIYSNVLSMDTSVTVLMPEVRRGTEDFSEARDYPVLYCLHGYGDDHTAWIRKSNIELATRKRKVVVVMPTVQRGYYADSEYSMKYYTYLTEELPRKLAGWFHISQERKDTFVMGNSMGGYGALRLALANPDKYAKVVALSPALPQTLYDFEDREFVRMITLAMGDKVAYESSENNLFRLIDRLEEYEGKKPDIYVCCGDKDPISREGFCLMNGYVGENAKSVPYRAYEGDGAHDWEFWNPQIAKAVEMFGFEENV